MVYANIWGILMVNASLYTIHGSYGYRIPRCNVKVYSNIKTPLVRFEMGLWVDLPDLPVAS